MKTSSIESFIRHAANRFGLDIHRYRSPQLLGHLPAMLAHHRINTVLDVGANVGQFAKSLRAAGYQGRIYSFEPLSVAYQKLLTTSRGDNQWLVGPRRAIGDSSKPIILHVAGNSVSSSTLRMLPSHVSAAPESSYVGTELVEQATLDDLIPQIFDEDSRIFLKIDTQGSEDRVLNGATKQLRCVQGIRLELSLVPLYEGQKLFDELDARLLEYGFHRWAVEPAFSDIHTGRMLQIDGTYFRG